MSLGIVILGLILNTGLTLKNGLRWILGIGWFTEREVGQLRS